MNDSEVIKRINLTIVIISFFVFLLELYLYVFVRNDNILNLFVTIAAGMVFIAFLTMYIKRYKDRDSDKKT
jgi:hypothetical protein